MSLLTHLLKEFATDSSYSRNYVLQDQLLLALDQFTITTYTAIATENANNPASLGGDDLLPQWIKRLQSELDDLDAATIQELKNRNIISILQERAYAYHESIRTQCKNLEIEDPTSEFTARRINALASLSHTLDTPNPLPVKPFVADPTLDEKKQKLNEQIAQSKHRVTTYIKTQPSKLKEMEKVWNQFLQLVQTISQHYPATEIYEMSTPEEAGHKTIPDTAQAMSIDLAQTKSILFQALNSPLNTAPKSYTIQQKAQCLAVYSQRLSSLSETQQQTITHSADETPKQLLDKWYWIVPLIIFAVLAVASRVSSKKTWDPRKPHSEAFFTNSCKLYTTHQQLIETIAQPVSLQA